MVALFTAGRGVFMINGNWEVPTLVDLQKQKKLTFEYGITPVSKALREPGYLGRFPPISDPEQSENTTVSGKSRGGPEIYRLCREASDLGRWRSHPSLSARSRERCLQGDVAE